jgi:hypothetical protein
VFEAKTHAEVTKQTAEREVAELTRQRNAVTGQLTQLREMLSGLAGLGTLPGEEQKTVEEAAEKADEVADAVEEVVDAAVETAEKAEAGSEAGADAGGSGGARPTASGRAGVRVNG